MQVVVYVFHIIRNQKLFHKEFLKACQFRNYFMAWQNFSSGNQIPVSVLIHKVINFFGII